MKRLWMSGAAAVMAMTISGVAAQTPPPTPPQNPPQQTPPQTQAPTGSMQTATTTTVTGCVYKERDIPGRTPNVAEKAGVLEDYILVASTDTSSATAGTSGTTPPATAGTTGSAALKHKAFKLEKIADEKLAAMVGKRVEVMGKVDAEASDTKPAGTPAADRSMGPDKLELPEFEVTSIREVEGACPATPNIRK